MENPQKLICPEFKKKSQMLLDTCEKNNRDPTMLLSVITAIALNILNPIKVSTLYLQLLDTRKTGSWKSSLRTLKKTTSGKTTTNEHSTFLIFSLQKSFHVKSPSFFKKFNFKKQFETLQGQVKRLDFSVDSLTFVVVFVSRAVALNFSSKSYKHSSEIILLL